MLAGVSRAFCIPCGAYFEEKKAPNALMLTIWLIDKASDSAGYHVSEVSYH